ncbi:hypothetical protein HID58_050725 [Brassica napus]|uniref:Uncharacterized protein n=1 Tax=Brassica napus TaxID=3708 RepID=A0ABQ8A716_BRANA|nr:hypothetical protein HID58_050725 [Brassica napus]
MKAWRFRLFYASGCGPSDGGSLSSFDVGLGTRRGSCYDKGERSAAVSASPYSSVDGGSVLNHLSRDVCGEEVLEWLASGEFWRYGGELHAAAALFVSRVFNVWAFGPYFECVWAGGPVVCGLHPFCIFAGLGPFH